MTANLITALRILCGALLPFFPFSSAAFRLLYLLGGLSDVLDGQAARHFGGATALGAKLDTAADVIFFAAAAYRLVRDVVFPRPLLLCALGIAVIKCANALMSLVLYHELLPEHTFMNRLTGAMLFLYPLGIAVLPWQLSAVYGAAVCAAAAFAAVQEGVFIRKGKKFE